jgi:hypothetical protein
MLKNMVSRPLMTFLLLKASSAFVLSRTKVFLPTVIVIASIWEERGKGVMEWPGKAARKLV